MKQVIERLVAVLVLAALLAGVSAAALGDELTAPLSETVPFGLAHSEDGTRIPVYKTASARSQTDTLADYQVCAILSAQDSGQTTWYRVRYVSGRELREGYVRNDGFYQLTVAGLISVAADTNAAAALKTLVSASNPYLLAEQAAAADPTATPSPTPKARVTATPKGRSTPTPASARKRYVLNTKTLKFHLPSCSEVARITQENKKTTTTTRESLIDQGYTPCQKCNP